MGKVEIIKGTTFEKQVMIPYSCGSGEFMPTPEWKPMRPHKQQTAVVKSLARFKYIAAARRSGKTEIVKRMSLDFARWCLCFMIKGILFIASPTRDQTKRIFWEHLKSLVPISWLRGHSSKSGISEQHLTIYFWWGVEIQLHSMQEPARMEGQARVLGFILDETADCPNFYDQFQAHIWPALMETGGFAWFLGVPDGKNMYYTQCMKAKREAAKARAENRIPESEFFTWHSSTVLKPAEVQKARREMDPMLFLQEMEGSFENSAGQIYHQFDQDKHVDDRICYNEDLPLILTFDFNRSPGVATIGQLQAKIDYPHLTFRNDVTEFFTAVLDEVFIPKDSNTYIVCEQIWEDWQDHDGEVHWFADSTGGRKYSSTPADAGSDLDIIEAVLGMESRWGDQLQSWVSPNPAERSRINSVNAHLCNAAGEVGCLISPACKNLILDFEQCIPLAGTTTREIDKNFDKMRSHISDGYGYYVGSEHRLGLIEILISIFIT